MILNRNYNPIKAVYIPFDQNISPIVGWCDDHFKPADWSYGSNVHNYVFWIPAEHEFWFKLRWGSDGN